MAKYEVGKLWFFPHIGDKPPVGSVIDLPEEDAERYMHNEPGLLKPVRHTTQAHPQAARGPAKKKHR
jgi:hypothetical protein